MSPATRFDHDRRFTGHTPGAVEPFVVECLPLIPILPVIPARRVLDIAAGSGRHSLLLARAGSHVVAVDHSAVALNTLAKIARVENLKITPVVAELENFPIRAQSYQAVLNVNYLDRNLLPALKDALEPGGVLLFDTFIVDQAVFGHPRNPDFMLGHFELKAMLDGLELVRYREGLTTYPNGSQAWRASALARRS